jgi:hypothetical protein
MKKELKALVWALHGIQYSIEAHEVELFKSLGEVYS